MYNVTYIWHIRDCVLYFFMEVDGQMNLKQWYINWWVKRIKIKYKNKYQKKYNQDIEKIQDEYDNKLSDALKIRERDYDKQIKRFEKIIAEKDKYINDILKNSKIETDKAIAQNTSFWKNIISDKDNTIKDLQNYKLNIRQRVVALRDCEEKFEQNKDEMVVDCESAEYYVKKGLQKLIKSAKSDKFINIRKTIDEIDDGFKE